MFNKKKLEVISELVKPLPMVIGELSFRHDFDELVAAALPKGKFALIDDVNTSLALGNSVARALKDPVHITLKDAVSADDASIAEIRSKTSKCDALIAVGSGTINDLCKYAAFLDNKPYITFPTAASMNGYLSANASITVKGHKTTFAAKLPAAVFCDFSVIAAAPVRLGKSGLGDCLARPTAQADWLLSHLLLGTAYNETPFQIIADIEPELFADAGGIAGNDPSTVRKLTELLLLSGLGMNIAGGSYPASQGEHMIAHTYGMLKNSAKKFSTLHGEEIGVTSLYMARRQDVLLKTKPKISEQEFKNNHISELFGSALSEEFSIEFDKKKNLVSSLRGGNADKAIQHSPAATTGLLCSARNDATMWDEIREKLYPVMLKPTDMENIIAKAKMLPAPEALGWNSNDYDTACAVARFTRDRFTFLDFE